MGAPIEPEAHDHPRRLSHYPDPVRGEAGAFLDRGVFNGHRTVFRATAQENGRISDRSLPHDQLEA